MDNLRDFIDQYVNWCKLFDHLSLNDRFAIAYDERFRAAKSGLTDDLLILGYLSRRRKPFVEEDFECYCDCCYNQDQVCMNPEGICGDRTEED